MLRNINLDNGIDRLSHLKEWIEEHCKKTGEAVEKFVVSFDNHQGKTSSVVPEEKCDKLLGPEDLSLLDFFVDGQHPVFVWTDKSVLFLIENKGIQSLYSAPRDPVDCAPKMFEVGIFNPPICTTEQSWK